MSRALARWNVFGYCTRDGDCAGSALEITMPRLYDWSVTALNEHNVTITRALNDFASTC